MDKCYAVVVNTPGYLPDCEPEYFGGPDALVNACTYAEGITEAESDEYGNNYAWVRDGNDWYGTNQGDGLDLVIEVIEISQAQYDWEIGRF